MDTNGEKYVDFVDTFIKNYIENNIGSLISSKDKDSLESALDFIKPVYDYTSINNEKIAYHINNGFNFVISIYRLYGDLVSLVRYEDHFVPISNSKKRLEDWVREYNSKNL